MIRTRGSTRVLITAWFAALVAASGAVQAAPIFFGPSPYLSAAASPFAGGTFAYFHRETFEDGALDTPGVSTSTPGVVLGPGALTDSVDADDGAIDGSRTGGHSWFSNGQTSIFRFDFSAAVLGALPTRVGIVWTDVGQATIPGFGSVTFEAFDPFGGSPRNDRAVHSRRRDRSRARRRRTGISASPTPRAFRGSRSSWPTAPTGRSIISSTGWTSRLFPSPRRCFSSGWDLSSAG